MADAVKVLIVERNGVELQEREELDLTPSNIPFSNANFSATDVNAGIIEAGTFGMRFTQAQDLTETSTTSTTTYSTKVTLSAASLPSGNYILTYACVHRTAAANRETDIRIADGGTALFDLRSSILRTQGSFPVSGFIYLSGVSGSKTYTLQFRVGGTATTSFVKDARLALWRVS
jgi:hypothetical protein